MFRSKLDTDLGTTQFNSHLYVDEAAIYDLAENPVVAVNSSTALLVNMYQPDVTNPRLLSFNFDLNTGLIVLSFDDVMLASSLRIDFLEIQSTVDGVSGTQTRSLTSGIATPDNGYEFFINMSSTDLNAIKANRDLATNASNTFLVMPPNALTDVAGVEVIGATGTQAFPVTVFTPDTQPPILQTFTLDLGNGELRLTFSEAVDPLVFNANQLTLQSASNASESGVATFTISGEVPGSLPLNPVDVIAVRITTSDLNDIKALDLGSNVNDTFISFPETLVTDVVFNRIVEISSMEAKQASMFETDVVAPTLDQFTFDLDEGLIILTFSESIQVSNVKFELFTLRSSSSAGATTYDFTGGTTTTTSGNIVRWNILNDDLNNIKANFGLATSNTTTFLSTTGVAFNDTSGNEGAPLPSLQTTEYIDDTTDPELLSFDFYLSNGLLVLSFSESVNHATFDPTSFTMQSAPAFAGSEVTFRGGDFNPSGTGPIVNLTLVSEDINFIKETVAFGSARGTTFISVNFTGVSDTSGNSLKLIPDSDALQVTNFFKDNVNPTLLGYSLDMNIGILTLTFSESIDTDALSLSSVTLQNSMSASPSANISLSGSTTDSTGLRAVVNVTISRDELNTIKATTSLAVSADTVFLSIVDSATSDVNNNPLTGIMPSLAISPDNFTADTTPPVLEGFEIILVTEPLTINLIFDETVDPTTLDIVQLSLTDGASASVTLNGTQTTALSTTVTLTIAQSVLTQIRETPGLARDSNSTYLTVLASSIADTANNSIAGITNFNITLHNADLMQPFVDSFTFDLNAGSITITFNENVQGAMLNTSVLYILNDTDSANEILLSNSMVSSASGSEVTIRLDTNTVDTLKLDPTFATSVNNTFLYHEALIVCDIANNCAEELLSSNAINASVFIPDTTSPRLIKFDLNVNASLFTLYFDEMRNCCSGNYVSKAMPSLKFTRC